MYTVEFQKRGLPHAHILLWLDNATRLKYPYQIDGIISAEIPKPRDDPMLYDAVKNFMIHGPCGAARASSPCMNQGKCTKHFPKKFNCRTSIDEDGYCKSIQSTSTLFKVYKSIILISLYSELLY